VRKTWVVGLVCLLVGALVAGGIFFVFQERQLTPEEELVRELEKFTVNGETVTGKVTLPPEARGNLKIDYRVDQEALRWMGRFELDVRISNVGEKEILYFELVSFLVDKDGNLHPEDEETVQRFANVAAMTLEEYRRFSPTMALPVPPLGKSIPVTVSFGKLGDLWEPAGGFIITVRNLHFVGEPAPEEPKAGEPAPGSPGAVVQAFFEAIRDGRHAEAAEYLHPELLAEAPEGMTIEEVFKMWSPIGKIMIGPTWIYDPAEPDQIKWDKEKYPDVSEVEVWADIEISGEEVGFLVVLKRINGVWKIRGL